MHRQGKSEKIGLALLLSVVCHQMLHPKHGTADAAGPATGLCLLLVEKLQWYSVEAKMHGCSSRVPMRLHLDGMTSEEAKLRPP